MLAQDRYRSFVVLGVALLAMWCVGLFARGWWRPDEPREAALVHSSATHPDEALPTLGGRVFAEKPTLTYQLAAESVRTLGFSPAAMRSPQLLYAGVALLSLMALARAAAGNDAALIVGLTFATFSLVYQTQIWLACDALLIAGVCIALLGMYRGLTAAQSTPRLWGYLLMYVGLTLAFFAKNFAGWLVPVSALLAFLLWERRLRELKRWELWAGVLIPATCIGLWIRHISQLPNGAESLRVLFWHNLVGRMLPVEASARYAYGNEHHNWPGKYFVELAWYVFPWTAAAWAAVRRAWTIVRIDTPERRAWRFAVCAVLPGLAILSFSFTARGIYAAPTLAGVALLIGLWAADPATQMSAVTRRSLAITAILIALVSAVVFLALLILQIDAGRFTFFGALGLVICGSVVLAASKVNRAHALDPTSAFRKLGFAYALLLSLGILQLYAAINRWQDLSQVADGVRASLAHRPLVLWRPDETTLAWTDIYLPGKSQRIFYTDEAAAQPGVEPLLSYLKSQPHAEVLALAAGKHWTVSTWFQYLRTGTIAQAKQPSLDFLPFKDRTDFHVDYEYEAPGGRCYVLLSHSGLGSNEHSPAPDFEPGIRKSFAWALIGP